MSLRVQKPGRPRTRGPVQTTHPDRPPIWAEGRQNPRFDLRAFLRAALTNARAVSAQSLEAGARRIGAAGSHLPRLAAGTQALCAGAAGNLRGQPPEDDADTRMITAVLASAFPSTAMPAQRPQPPRPLTDSDPTLAAIRAVLREEATRPANAPAPRLPPDRRGAAPRVLAALAVVLLLPFGAASALYAHLSGEDLRLTGGN